MTTSTYTSRAGGIVRQLREQRGLSRDALAAQTGISSSGIYKLETSGQPPRRSTLVALSRALRVRLSDLTGNPADR